MRTLHLDFETFSSTPIDVGVHVYVASPDFTVTAMAWAFDDGPVSSLMWPSCAHLPPEIEQHIRSGGMVCAHNAPFEHAVLNSYYGFPTKVEQMTCTMARALAYGLPAALGEACDALGLAITKDKTARQLMLAMGKPRTKARLPPWHEVDPARLDRLRKYCKQDVEAERALSKTSRN